MSDLISRSALLKSYDIAKMVEYDETGCGVARIAIPVQVIKDAPAVDAAPVVHARWVHEQRYGDSGGWVWRCTACRLEAISPIISALHYCNHCGAKMDGGAEC